MKKTTIENTTTKNITAKITATALLFFVALFTLTTNLMSQEKQGWFVGVSPYFLGAKIKTTTENTTLTERYRERTRTLSAGVTYDVSTTDRVQVLGPTNEALPSSDHYDNLVRDAVLEVCADGAYDSTGTYSGRDFDATSNRGPAAKTNDSVDACYKHFQGLADSFYKLLTGVTVDSATLSFSTTSENTPLTGNGLQLGYNFEKFRVSLNSHLWSAGENKLDSQLLLLDYFLPYGLYAGGGFGTAKLDTSIGSASKTAPALHFGYQHNFTDNFSLEAGLLWFGASFSLEKSAAAPEATISDIAIPEEETLNPITSSALVGGYITSPGNDISSLNFQDSRGGTLFTLDRRILVTGTVTPAYSYGELKSKTEKTTMPTKTTHEVEAPTSLFVRLVYSF